MTRCPVVVGHQRGTVGGLPKTIAAKRSNAVIATTIDKVITCKLRIWIKWFVGRTLPINGHSFSIQESAADCRPSGYQRCQGPRSAGT
jgi:hypothetical protein